MQCLWEGGECLQQVAVKTWENKMPSFLLSLFHSTQSNTQLCMATCHWPLPSPIFIHPLRLHMTARSSAAFGKWSHSRNFQQKSGQEQEQHSADLEPLEVVSRDILLLTNFIVSITGCRITGVEMQDVKLSWEWLRRCFHYRIIESVLFMQFKSCLLLGYYYDSSLLLLCSQRIHLLIKKKKNS